MANDKLSQGDLQTLFTWGLEAREKFNELEALRSTFEQEAAAIIEAIKEAQGNVRDVMEDAANEAESYFDEKSEKWQEGERGERFAEWKNTLREIADSLDEDIEIEVTMPEEPDWVGRVIEPDFEEVNY